MRPLSWVGLAIMVAAVFVGFVPTIWSIMMLFATTLIGGHYIHKNADKEEYDRFIILFGWGVALANGIAAGMIMLSNIPYVDKASAAFLNIMVAMVIITMIKINGKKPK